METIHKLLAIKGIPEAVSLETEIQLDILYAIFIVTLPPNISKSDFDSLCHRIDEELIKQKLTLHDTYIINDFGTFHFRVNYPIG